MADNIKEYFNIINDEYINIVKNSSIHIKFKVEIVDVTEKNIIKDITPLISKGSLKITENYQQGTRLSCSFSLINNDGSVTPSHETGMLWIGTKIKVHIGLKSVSNGDIYWFPKGVYYVSSVNSSRRDQMINVEATDKFSYLTGDLGYNQITGTYKFTANQKVYKIIKDILMLDMGNGSVIDSIPPVLDPAYKDEVLPYDINKTAGTGLGEILIELANVLGCNIFYDNNGALNIQSGTLDISYSQLSSVWDFKDVLTEYTDSSMNYNYSGVVNVITVIGNNTNDKIYSYTAENNNILSPTRIEYIGRKESEPVETSMAYSEERAKEYAEFLLQKKSILQSTIDFTCTFIPHLVVDNVITISDRYYGLMQERFIIQSINVGDDGTMQISASNIAQLPYYEIKG